MRLLKAEQRTAEPQNIQPQNIEGWNRCALSFEAIKNDRIPYFGILHSIFIIRYSLFHPRKGRRKAEVFYSIKLAVSAASGWAEL